jgi:hypothetical protein
MDSKSIGLCPQGFESPRCRFLLNAFWCTGSTCTSISIRSPHSCVGLCLPSPKCPHQESNLGCRGHNATSWPLDDKDLAWLHQNQSPRPTKTPCVGSAVSPLAAGQVLLPNHRLTIASLMPPKVLSGAISDVFGISALVCQWSGCSAMTLCPSG